MASLLELVLQSQELEKAVLESDGELSEELEEALEVHDLSVGDKVESLIFVRTRLKAQAEFFKLEYKRFYRASKALSNAYDKLTENIKFAMNLTGRTVVTGNTNQLKLGNRQSSIIVDERLLPREFMVETITYTPNTEMIRKGLEGGATIPGAKLEPSFALLTQVKKS